MSEDIKFMPFGQIHTEVDPKFLAKAFRESPDETVDVRSYIFTVLDGEFYGQRMSGPKHVLCMLMTTTDGVSGVGIATCSDLDEFIPARGQQIAFMRAVREARYKKLWDELGDTLIDEEATIVEED